MIPAPSLSIFANVFDNRPAQGGFDTWSNFADALEWLSHGEADSSDKESTICLSPARYPHGAQRSKTSALSWDWFGCDIDNKKGNRAGATMADITQTCADMGLAFVIYTTASSRPDAECFRLILPLSRPIPAKEFDATWASVATWLGCLDQQTKDVSRLFIAPRRWQGGQNAFLRFDDGAPLDIDAICWLHPLTASEVETINRRSAPRMSDTSHLGLRPLPMGSLSLSGTLISPTAVQKARTGPIGGRMFGFLLGSATRAMMKGYEVSVADLVAVGRELAGELGRSTQDIHHDAESALAMAITTVTVERAKRLDLQNSRNNMNKYVRTF